MSLVRSFFESLTTEAVFQSKQSELALVIVA
jgi:hypothetical protein